MDMHGSVIVVTGASDRIGRLIAIETARLGASVVVHYHTDRTGAEKTVETITSLGGSAVCVQADLMTSDGIDALVRSTLREFGRWDALVNGASVFETVGIEEVDDARWDEDQLLHVKAPFFLSKALFTVSKTSDRQYPPACVVNLTDTHVYVPGTSRPSYILAKAALADQARVLGKALAPYVRVNAVAPGAILPASASDETYFSCLEKELPLRKLATPVSVVEAVIFLLKNDSVTGQTIVVDGGEHLRYIQGKV